jgi:cell division protein FtsQ
MLGSRTNRRRPDRAEQLKAVAGALGRVLRVLLWTGAAAALIAGSVYGFKYGRHWALTSPIFAIRGVDVTGTARLDPATLRAASGLAPGQNLFQIDLAEAQRAIAQNPWVHHVAAKRLFSRRVLIQIDERKPVAQLALGNLYLVDPDGELFKRVVPGDGVDLPLITGIDRERFDANREEARSEISRALSLLSELAQRRLPEISEIHVDPELGMTAYLGPDATAVKVGWGDIDGKLDRYERTRAELERRHLAVTQVDLTDAQHPGRIGLTPVATAH